MTVIPPSPFTEGASGSAEELPVPPLQAVHTPIDKKLLCANLQPRCEVLGEIPEQLDFFDAMPDYDVSLYTNKKQKTTPETKSEAKRS